MKCFCQCQGQACWRRWPLVATLWLEREEPSETQADAIPESCLPASFDCGTIWQGKTQRNKSIRSQWLHSLQSRIQSLINLDGKVSVSQKSVLSKTTEDAKAGIQRNSLVRAFKGQSLLLGKDSGCSLSPRNCCPGEEVKIPIFKGQ